MFAYCGNNPVAFADPFGLCLCNAGSLKNKFSTANYCTGCGLAGAAIGTAVTDTILSYAVDTIEETKQKVIAWIESCGGDGEQRDNSVYILTDPNNGNLVKYVGRTNNPVRRANEHKNDPFHPERKGYEMKVLVSGLTLDEARLVEQVVISVFTVAYLENARREIAVSKIDQYAKYMGAVAEMVGGASEEGLYGLIVGG